MPEDNLTAVLHGIEDMRLEQRPIPTIKDDEVLIRMDSVGICGSDVHYLRHGRCADFILKKPMIIGHESSGIVAKLGSKVTSLSVGDRVAIEPGVPCRYCQFCKDGRYNLCADIIFCATPPCDGNLTRYFAHAADFCFKLPDNVSMEEGAMLEPLSVGVHACRRAQIAVDSIVLILGAGPIGLVSLLAAKAMGASKVLITDLQESRLNLAKSIGADYTYKIDLKEPEGEVVKKIHQILGVAPDKTIDCTGFESTARLCVLATRTGGVAVMVGMGALEVKVPLVSALAREVDIKGVFRYCNDYALALEMIASGKINVKPLITNHYMMEETHKAFQTAREQAPGVVKVMIHCLPRNTNNKIPI